MALIGSNTDVSLPTAQGSVLTAAGICAPFPGQFIEDGSSVPTGGNSLLTATQASCGVTPDDVADMIYWLLPDVAVTKNGSNQVSLWGDQAPHHRDVPPANSLGTIAPTSRWPVYTPNVFPSGLAGLLSNPGTGPNTGTVLTWVPPGNPPNEPTADGAPVTMLGFGLATGTGASSGGIFATLRLTSFDLELGYRNGTNPDIGACTFWVSTNADHDAYVDQPQRNLSGQVIVLALEYYGAGIPPFLLVNGVQHTFTTDVDGGLQNYSGNSGFAIGWIPSVDAGHFPGYLGEQMALSGTNRARTLRLNAYMMKRAGVA